jgi:zinc protease
VKRTLTLPVLLLLAVLLTAACQPIQPAGAGGTVPMITASAGGEVLPFDPAVRVGTLDNGLTYYVRHNAEPPNRAELWLAVNAGSVLEEEDQLGLAHFLEHMLFNGTEEFPQMELVNFLESIGMEFGPDVNAYTSFDETVYTLQVPTDDAGTLDTAFDVLKEWAAHALVDPSEVDAERGVIVEEWRLRDLNAAGRVNDELIATLLAGSTYAERLPIGDMDVIRNTPPDALRRYYETWYRPDNMAVVAVGDFADLDAVEAAIRERFGALQNPDAPLDRTRYTVPDYGETNASVITDPEFPSTAAYVIYKHEAVPVQTRGQYRDFMVDLLVSQMLNYRFQEILRQADAPFLYAGAGVGDFVRPVKISQVFVQTENEAAASGLEAAMLEIERARRHGFGEAELARARAELLRLFQNNYDERNNLPNRAWAQTFLNHFLTGTAPTSAEEDFALAQEFIPGVTLDEVNAHVLELFPLQNRAVVLTAPEKEGVTPPTTEELTGILAAAAEAEVEPYTVEAIDAELMAEAPAPVEIVAEETLADLGITRIELENGVELYLKPTDFKDDEVVFQTWSPGGTSLLEEPDVPEAALAPQIVAQSGVGDFTQNELDRLLAGKSLTLAPYVSETGEGFSGSASPQDLETLFQLLHLYAAEPRVDADAFTTFRRQVDDYLTNRELDPQSALEDKRNEIFCGPSVRCNDVELLEEVASLDLDRALEIYNERFADFGDTVVLISGAFDPETARTLAATYLGTLPATEQAETWRDVGPDLPEGTVEETVNKGIDPSSSVALVYSGPFTPTVENRVALNMVRGVLDILVREDLREARGGIYGAGIGAGIEVVPEETYEVSIWFTAEPTRVNELVGAVFTQVADLRDNGPSEVNFEKVREQLLRDHEENLEDNNAWLTWMDRYLTTGEGELADILRIQEAIENVTPEQVQAMAQQVLNSDDYVRLILHPEGFEP